MITHDYSRPNRDTEFSQHANCKFYIIPIGLFINIRKARDLNKTELVP